MMKRVLIATIYLFFAQVVFAQNTIKQGKIFYEMDFPDIPAEQKTAMAEMLPKDATAYFKDSKTRVETPMPFGKLIIIRDPNKKHFLFAFNNAERKKKVAFIKTDEEIKKMLGDSNKFQVAIEITKETKKIAGFTATKAILKMKVNGQDIVTECWFSKEVPKINMGGEQDDVYSKLDGGLLEYTTVQGGIKTIMRIRQLVQEEVNDKLFELGPSYKMVNNEEELATEMLK